MATFSSATMEPIFINLTIKISLNNFYICYFTMNQASG